MINISDLPRFHRGQAVRKIDTKELGVVAECYLSGRVEVKLEDGATYLSDTDRYEPVPIVEKDPQKRHCTGCRNFGLYAKICPICSIAAGFEFFAPKGESMDKVTNIYGHEFKVGDEAVSANYGICTIASISSCSLIYIALPCTSVRATAISDLRRGDSDKLPPETEPEWFDYSYNAEIIAAIKEGRGVWYKSPSDEWKLLQNAATCSLHTTYNFQWTLTKPTRKVIKDVEIWSNKYKDGFRAFYSSEDEAIKNIIPGCIATVKLTGQYEVEE